MQNKNTDILKWIILLTVSQVSGFVVLQFNDLNGTLVNKLLNAVKDTNIHNEEDYQKSVMGTLTKHIVSNNNSGRKNQGTKEFTHKKLVKRIIPHGYQLKDIEYDKKFNTIFKPLVRIHKKKPDLDESSDEDRFDLIYVLDDKKFEDNALVEDNSLLQPFVSDNADIRYIVNDNKAKYNTESVKNSREDNFGQINQFSEHGQHRFKLVDRINEMKNTPNNYKNVYADDDKIKQVIGTQREDWIKHDQNPAMSKLLELIDDIAKVSINKKKQLRKQEKSHYTSAGPLLSKHFIREKKINEYVENVVSPYELKPLKIKRMKNRNYVDFINVPQEHVEKQMNIQENKKEIPPLGWFGPLGGITSKQFKKPSGYTADDIKIKRNKLRYYQTNNEDNLFGTLKQMIKHNIDTSNEDRSIAYHPLPHNTRGWFGSIGSVNSKHIKHNDLKDITDTARIPFYIIKPNNFKSLTKKDIGREEIRSNKFTLLNDIAKLKARYQDDETKLVKEKQVKEIKSKNRDHELLRHVKSGEEEEAALIEKQKLDPKDNETTTKRTTVRPFHSFWNEWTYDKQIGIDECPGHLVQLGRLCVGAFS